MKYIFLSIILLTTIVEAKITFKSATFEKDKKVNLRKNNNIKKESNNGFYYKEVDSKKNSSFNDIENFFEKNNNGVDIHKEVNIED